MFLRTVGKVCEESVFNGMKKKEWKEDYPPLVLMSESFPTPPG